MRIENAPCNSFSILNSQFSITKNMACAGCTVGSKEAGAPTGCQSKGSCASGSCNRLNTFDWLTTMEIEDVDPFHVVEVSFKNGSRKAFFFNQPYTRTTTGDMVVFLDADDIT